jgi:hypothetical protein
MSREKLADREACGCHENQSLLVQAIRQALQPLDVLAAQTVIIPAGGGPVELDWHVPFSAVAVNVVSSAAAASGGTATANSNTFAAAAAGTVPLAAGASITGFDVTMVAPAAAVNGLVTVQNLAAGNMNYELEASATSGGLLSIRYPNPLPASSAVATPQVAVPAIASGAAYAVSVYGLTAATAAGTAQPLTIAAGTAGVAAPSSGPGVVVLPPNKGGVFNLRGHSLSIYGGTAGDTVTVQAFTRPQRVSWG